MSQTHRADAAVATVLDSLLATRSDAGAAGSVFKQLLSDYPADALGWVLAARWEGPEDVPLDEIDMADRDKWKAAKDGTVDKHKKLIEAGKAPPAILVKPPGNAKYIVVDGHHRTLASEQLRKPLRAYVADVQVPNGPWLALHTMQRKGSSKGSVSVEGWETANADSVDHIDFAAAAQLAFACLGDQGIPIKDPNDRVDSAEERRETAIHEASHVVELLHHPGSSFSHVSIDSRPDPAVHGVTHRDTEAAICTCLAGPIGCREVLGAIELGGARGDFTRALDLAGETQVFRADGTDVPLVQDLADDVTARVAMRRDAILALAEALLKHGTRTEAQCKQIVGPMPTVKSTPLTHSEAERMKQETSP